MVTTSGQKERNLESISEMAAMRIHHRVLEKINVPMQDALKTLRRRGRETADGRELVSVMDFDMEPLSHGLSHQLLDEKMKSLQTTNQAGIIITNMAESARHYMAAISESVAEAYVRETNGGGIGAMVRNIEVMERESVLSAEKVGSLFNAGNRLMARSATHEELIQVASFLAKELQNSSERIADHLINSTLDGKESAAASDSRFIA